MGSPLRYIITDCFRVCVTDWFEITITDAALLLLIGQDRLRVIKTMGVLLIERG